MFKNKIENKFKKDTENILKNLKFFNLLQLERAYASANPYGTVHESHRDYDINSNGGITVMYYLNNSWDLSLGGETVFYDINKYDIQKSVIPKPGRVVIFDGLIEHCARDTTRNFNDLRISIVYRGRCFNSSFEAKQFKQKLYQPSNGIFTLNNTSAGSLSLFFSSST